MLRYIASLGARKDRFKELETALWEHVDVLVPTIMSMSDWTKSLQNLRMSNMEVARESGSTSEDPLAAIRDFLASPIPAPKSKAVQ